MSSVRYVFIGIALAVTTNGSTVACAQAQSSSDVVSTKKLSWRLAAELAIEAVAACEAQGYPVTVSVVDSGGNQQALSRAISRPRTR